MRITLTVDMERHRAGARATVDRWFLGVSPYTEIHRIKRRDAEAFRATGEISTLLQGEADIAGITVEELVGSIEAAAAEAEAKLIQNELMRREAIKNIMTAKSPAELETVLDKMGAEED